MKELNNSTLVASVSHLFSSQIKLIPFFMIGIFCWLIPTSLSAAKAVKPLSNKVLKNIEEKYDKETRNMFSGKGSERNVLALKRLIADEVHPDVAIAAILKYDESKRYRSGSVEKRAAIAEMEALFANSHIHWKKGRDILMRAGTAIQARKDKSELHTFHDTKAPTCRSKRVETRKKDKVSHEDPDQLAENVLLTELTGSVKKKGAVMAAR